MNDLPPVPPDSDFFPVRCTSLPAAGQYTFAEVWMLADGTIADRIGGRVNSASDPAYAIDGSTFAVTAAGSPVQALCRRANGAGGTRWELKGSGGVVVNGRFNYYFNASATGTTWSLTGVRAIIDINPSLYTAIVQFAAGDNPVFIDVAIGIWNASFADPNDDPNFFVMSPMSFNLPANTNLGVTIIAYRTMGAIDASLLLVEPVYTVVSGGPTINGVALHFTQIPIMLANALP